MCIDSCISALILVLWLRDAKQNTKGTFHSLLISEVWFINATYPFSYQNIIYSLTADAIRPFSYMVI
jgi:hypothetical protein